MKNNISQKPYHHVGLGGTFDHLHQGHKFLLQTAFKLGKIVHIAIATDALLATKKHRNLIQDYTKRYQTLLHFIQKDLSIPKDNFELIPLNDPFGPAIESEELEVHISSMETYQVAMKINQVRLERGISPLILVIVPLISDSSGRRFSSTHIRERLAESDKSNF